MTDIGYLLDARIAREDRQQADPLLRSQSTRCHGEHHNHVLHLHPDGLASGISIRDV